MDPRDITTWNVFAHCDLVAVGTRAIPCLPVHSGARGGEGLEADDELHPIKKKTKAHPRKARDDVSVHLRDPLSNSQQNKIARDTTRSTCLGRVIHSEGQAQGRHVTDHYVMRLSVMRCCRGQLNGPQALPKLGKSAAESDS